MPKSILTIIVLFALPFAANARVAPSEADLLRHIEVLAADEMQGRAPGTRGEAMAAQYIASQFSAAGLEPGYNGHFYQPVALVERTPIEATGSWIGPEGRGQIGMDDIVSVGREPEIHIDSAPIYFAGTGLRIGAADGDPLAGLDLEGAVVLLMLQTEAERAANDAEPAVSRDERQAILREHGVAAVYLVPPNQELAQSIAGFFAAGRFGLASESGVPAEGVIGYELGQSLFAASNIDPAELAERTGQADAEAIRLSVRMSLDTTTDVRRFNGLNVVGRLSGVAETDETVAFMAHYDHLGLCRDESAEDRICNGAVDNASGTAALIETAAALADQGGHPRNLLFIATTAEERGLFGARAFVADPSVPLDKIVAMLNMDTIATAPAGEPVGIVGRGLTGLDPIVDEVAREIGLEVDSSDALGFLARRQDGAAFLDAGVPAIMVGSFSLPILEAFLGGIYHSPEDEVERIELGGAHQDLLLHIALGAALADPQRYPRPAR